MTKMSNQGGGGPALTFWYQSLDKIIFFLPAERELIESSLIWTEWTQFLDMSLIHNIFLV